MTLMAFNFSPTDTPIEKGGKNYLALELVQFPYASDITIYCMYLHLDQPC